MAIITRYLTRELFKVFAILMATLITVYFSVEFFEKIDDLIENRVPVATIVRYFLMKLPFILTQMMPLCLLLAVLVIFGLMTRHNEIMALRSSGVSIYYLFSPIFLISVLFAIVLFLLAEAVVPTTMAVSNQIWNSEVKKLSVQTSGGKNIWLKGNRYILHITFYDPLARQMNGVTLNQFDPDFRLVRRVDADRGEYREGRWHLNDVMLQTLKPAGEGFKVTFHDTLNEALDVIPEDLMRVAKASEEMSYAELDAYVEKVESEGYDATSYRVDLYAKVAFPLVCVLLAIIGTGVSFKWRVRENLPVSITIGIGIAFLYWTFNSFCLSLGYGTVLPPLVAAWTANAVFFCLGAFVLISAE